MKIGIEGQRLLRPKKHGMDMVALELIKNLQRLDTENEYVVFVRPDQDTQCIPPAPNFRVVALKAPFGYAGWEQWALPRAAAREGCDLLHCTSNTGPLFCRVPLLTTLHDIIYLERSNLLQREASWYQRLGNLYRRYVVPPVARKSQRVITVSEFERGRICARLGLEPSRLHAIYNGVGEHFRPIHNPELLDSVRQRYRLPERFFLFLGNTDPKKNMNGVLGAFALFCERSPEPIDLVMLDFGEQELQARLAALGKQELRERIHLCGYVPNQQLPALLNACEGFLYPSLRESFGLPILEGLACGVPVITSNAAAMPEVAGDGTALLVDPTRPEEIAGALLQLSEKPAWVAQRARKGLERAGQFSWQAMAAGVLEHYRQVIYKQQSPATC